MPNAYSYVRYSSPQQADGDSVRRQTANRDVWLRSHPTIPLDTTLRMTDAGKSAFSREEDMDTYALGGFVRAIESGRVQKGDYLLVENLDRLSRENEGLATERFLSIVNKGVIIVQLSPHVVEYARPVRMPALITAILELSRGHSESAMKSDRSGKVWGEKKKNATKGTLVTTIVPGWIVVNEDTGERTLHPEHTETVRRIFALAIAGDGSAVIANKLHADGVPTMGRSTYKGRAITWNEGLTYSILTSPATYGAYQPGKRTARNKRVPEGDLVEGYFPAAVDKRTFDAAAGAMVKRKGRGAGRRGSHVNLFSGLLFDARGGVFSYKHYGARKPALLVPGHGQRDGAAWVSFPLEPFETAILSALTEVKSEDVAGESDHAKELASVAGRIARLDGQIKLWAGQMEDATDPATVKLITEKLDGWNATRRALVTEQTTLERAVANPMTQAWGEARGLLGLLATDPSDEMRVKIKAALRRTIEGVWCLFIPGGNGTTRIAAVRVQFAGSERHRDYLIVHRKTSTEVRSFADATGGTELDLRRPDHAKDVEAALLKLDL